MVVTLFFYGVPVFVAVTLRVPLADSWFRTELGEIKRINCKKDSVVRFSCYRLENCFMLMLFNQISPYREVVINLLWYQVQQV